MAEEIAKLLKDLTTTAEVVPEEVTAWLGRLVLFYGVPFQYLVPEEEMLPAESLRFFYVDPIWVQCLVQGACSVGNGGVADALIDGAMNSLVQPNGGESATGPSITGTSAAGVRGQLRRQYEGIPAPSGNDLAWPLTGFLLRSAVVSGWRGLEFTAKQADGKELQALRIEQLAPDIMLGIFNGTLEKLVVRQPQESLHFGLAKGRNSYEKTLRDLNTGEIFSTNPIISVNLTESNLMRKQELPGVIKVADLALEMKKKLKGHLVNDEKFTSAEFAVEMIEAAGEFTFTRRA
jgi:hypothetical protein